MKIANKPTEAAKILAASKQAIKAAKATLAKIAEFQLKLDKQSGKLP
jgi:hypothetical protein